MKKILNLSLISVALLAFNSCNKEDFDVQPSHLDTPASIFKTEQGFRTAVDGAYDAIKGMYDGDAGNAVIMADVLADNLIINPSGRFSNKEAYEWGFSPTSGSVTGTFYDAYFAISRANLVLDNIGNLADGTFKNNITAEARAIRGYLHFEVARAYAKIPTQSADANSSLGIPYITTYNPTQRPSRDASVAESYQKIVADLEFAYNNINTNNGGVGRFNKNSVAAALSEVYLYMGDYTKAASFAEIVINASPSVGTIANFPGVWTDSNSDGVLMKLLNAAASYDNTIVGVAYNQNAGGIKSEYNVNYELYTQYGTNDVRRNAYFLTQSFSGNTYNHIIKYRTRAGSTIAGLVDPKFFRTAEVYLNAAEAYMRNTTAPNPARALALLNALRSARYTGFVSGTESGAALLDAIMMERRKELAFENDRFWTLKRLGLPVVRSNFGPNFDGLGTPPPASIITLPANSHKWQLPIPQDEMNINPNMVQNPGY